MNMPPTRVVFQSNVERISKNKSTNINEITEQKQKTKEWEIGTNPYRSEHHIVLSRRSVNVGPLLMKMMGSNQFSSWWYSVPI